VELLKPEEAKKKKKKSTDQWENTSLGLEA
jgi:hypothetical protein